MAYKKVCQLQDIPAGRSLKVVADLQRFALFKLEGKVFAISDTCPHKGASLSEGAVEAGMVTCPLHHWKFDIRTGAHPGADSVKVRTFAVELRGNEVWLDVPDPYA